MVSKSKIDRAGVILSDLSREYDEITLELDYVFEGYRKDHLGPLTQLTLELQKWLHVYGGEYYIAQRLKRRPQILRKLRRLSVRLTQLQDIGGCRIIVDKNEDVDKILFYISEKLSAVEFIKIVRGTDYRELGREDSGYRAYHLLLSVSGYKIELQLRSRMQHYWSESIERTSVIYGRRLKEADGDPEIIRYFKMFSDGLHSLEIGNGMEKNFEINLQKQKNLAEAVISSSVGANSLSGHVNSDIVQAMAEREGKNKGDLNNWILVFDWRDGNFVLWDVVGRSADEAIEAYTRYERQFPEEDKYEVVLIGTSDVSTVPNTHSHYFGIEHHNNALEDMEHSIIGLARRSELDVGARRILLALMRRRYWGKNTVLVSTLRNHFCQNIASFDSSLQLLKSMGYIIGSDPVSLDIRRAKDINEFA